MELRLILSFFLLCLFKDHTTALREVFNAKFEQNCYKYAWDHNRLTTCKLKVSLRPFLGSHHVVSYSNETFFKKFTSQYTDLLRKGCFRQDLFSQRNSQSHKEELFTRVVYEDDFNKEWLECAELVARSEKEGGHFNCPLDLTKNFQNCKADEHLDSMSKEWLVEGEAGKLRHTINSQTFSSDNDDFVACDLNKVENYLRVEESC